MRLKILYFEISNTHNFDKKPLTNFRTIFRISTSYLLTGLNLMKFEEGKLSPPTTHPSIHPTVQYKNRFQ